MKTLALVLALSAFGCSAEVAPAPAPEVPECVGPLARGPVCSRISATEFQCEISADDAPEFPGFSCTINNRGEPANSCTTWLYCKADCRPVPAKVDDGRTECTPLPAVAK